MVDGIPSVQSAIDRFSAGLKEDRNYMKNRVDKEGLNIAIGALGLDGQTGRRRTADSL